MTLTNSEDFHFPLMSQGPEGVSNLVGHDSTKGSDTHGSESPNHSLNTLHIPPLNRENAPIAHLLSTEGTAWLFLFERNKK